MKTVFNLIRGQSVEGFIRDMAYKFSQDLALRITVWENLSF